MRQVLHFAGAVMLFIGLGSGTAAAQSAGDAFGTWLTKNGTHVEVYKCAENLCIKIVKTIDVKTKLPAPDLKDVNNKDKSLRGRLMQGTDIMKDARKTSGLSWDGKIYNADNGKTYSGTLTVMGRDALQLKGCVGWVFCKSEAWTRVK